jgi:hypothetical protein
MPPAVVGESKFGSVRCGNGRLPLSLCHAWTLADVRLTAILGESTGAPAKVLSESLAQISLGQ